MPKRAQRSMKHKLMMKGMLMKTLIIIFILTISGIYLFRKRFKRKKPHDNAGRRSGKERRKTFDATKNHMRRSDRDRRSQKDRRKFQRVT